MEPMTNYDVDDPYPVPFDSSLPLEVPEEILLFGLLPCLCEDSGWLPTDDGGYVRCWMCEGPR